jgi:hypothetical protein
MIVRKADEVDPWTAEKAMANYYRPNSVVWYQKDDKTQGWVYRAKSDYVKSRTPPDEDDKWVKDYSFYLPWKAGNKYEIGMRVYFFNGQRLYGYIASRRYFGGTGEPNSEVDDDGVRTWEIDFKYDNYYYYQVLPTEFLFPVKKRSGFIDEKVNAFTHTDPEERPTAWSSYNSINGTYDEFGSQVIAYCIRKGFLKDDYREYNSKYQSYAYDPETYVFYEQKLDANNKSIHRKRGLHRAKFLKELNPKDPNFTHAESQFRWTLRYSNVFWQYGDYFNPHGFSIEMWPNANDDDYELIPSYGFKSFGYYSLGSFGSGSFTFPQVSGGVYFASYYYSYVWLFNTGVGMTGGAGSPAPDGQNYPETPDSELKFDAFFSRNCPAFDGRVMRINFIKIEESYQWIDRGFWVKDCETCPRYWVENWSKERIGYEPDADLYTAPWYSESFTEETIDSYEESYKWGGPNGVFDVNQNKVRDKAENPIDFNKHKSFLVDTYIEWMGSK